MATATRTDVRAVIVTVARAAYILTSDGELYYRGPDGPIVDEDIRPGRDWGTALIRIDADRTEAKARYRGVRHH